MVNPADAKRLSDRLGPVIEAAEKEGRDPGLAVLAEAFRIANEIRKRGGQPPMRNPFEDGEEGEACDGLDS